MLPKSKSLLPARRGDRRGARRGDTTQLSILEAAERCFAEGEFDGVSLRTITKVAGVDLGLVNYHFGSKENLLREVVGHRAKIVHEDRVGRSKLRDRRPARARRLLRQSSPRFSSHYCAACATASGVALLRQPHFATGRVAAIHKPYQRRARSHSTALHQRAAPGAAQSLDTIDLLGLYVPHRLDGAGYIGDRTH